METIKRFLYTCSIGSYADNCDKFTVYHGLFNVIVLLTLTFIAFIATKL